MNTNNSIPNTIKPLLERLASEFKTILQDDFIGFYIHGSIAMNCFNYQESDVDFLVVVKNSINKIIKKQIINLLLKLSKEAPQKGFEMSIIKQSELDVFKYPTPFELHFSNSHIEEYKNNPEYICGNDKDADLAAHIVITQERGICFLGKEIKKPIPKIPKMCNFFFIR